MGWIQRNPHLLGGDLISANSSIVNLLNVPHYSQEILSPQDQHLGVLVTAAREEGAENPHSSSQIQLIVCWINANKLL